ncbi:MAG TPA: hypothetical protein VL422_05835 [Miltoncostaea sp.]|nr:hypothetical protein [Miltoncostaea sp.]
MRRRLIAAAAIVVVAVGGAAAGCGGDDDSGQSSAEAQVCSSLDGFKAALQNVEGVQLRDPTANANNITLKRVKATWSGVEESAKQLSAADADAVSSALSNLDTAVQDLPRPISIQDARSQLQPKLTAVDDALQEMRDGIQCS